MLTIRSRPIPTETIEEKHAAFAAGVAPLGADWGFQNGLPPAPEMGQHLSGIVQLSKLLPRSVKGRITYAFRPCLRDRALCDDVLYLEFNPHVVDYRHVAMSVFPTYVSAFRGYRGELGDIQFVDQDFDDECETDARHSVYRIYPIAAYDSILCQRAFHLSPSSIATRLAGFVDQVDARVDGLIVIGSQNILTFGEASELSTQLRLRIQNESPT